MPLQAINLSKSAPVQGIAIGSSTFQKAIEQVAGQNETSELKNALAYLDYHLDAKGNYCGVSAPDAREAIAEVKHNPNLLTQYKNLFSKIEFEIVKARYGAEAIYGNRPQCYYGGRILDIECACNLAANAPKGKSQ